jgi:hypothetical protein
MNIAAFADRRLAVLVLVMTFGVPATNVHAQQSVADVLTFLVTNQSVVTGAPDRDQAAAQATSNTISRALRENLATLPLTTSSGAFVYRLNPDLGTMERVTQSFGPLFIERALTAGARQVSLGLTFQRLRFTSLDGHDLRDGSFVTTANQFVDEQAPFDIDQLQLNISASVTTLYGNVGVTDRLDVGFAVPLISLQLDGTRVNTYRGRAFTQANASASAVGLADVVVRSKYRLFNANDMGLAGAVDIRLPTGNPDDLLGAGATSVRFSGIASIERERVSSHFNAGVSVGGLSREMSYGGAVSAVATNRLTISGELLGRWINSPGGIVPVSAVNPKLAGVQTIRVLPDASTLHTLVIVPGAKWNVSAMWVLTGSVVVPLTKGGLTSPYTPVVGLEYSFGK